MSLTVLVTSGGTISKIDDVRYISNFSSGKTGAEIAEEFLMRGHNVHYLHAHNAQRPFRRNASVDFSASIEQEIEKIRNAYYAFVRYQSHLQEHPIYTFEEYQDTMRQILTTIPIDVVILAAAVSDYGVKTISGKISSDIDQLKLEMVKYPKVISSIKKWQPKVFQVGFKLMSRATPEELVEAGYQSGLRYGSDLTVANSIIEGKFERRIIVIIGPRRDIGQTTSEQLPKTLVDMILTTHSLHTILRNCSNLLRE